MFESPDITLFDFCLWVWMKNEVYERTVDTGAKLLAHILDAAAHVKKFEGQLTPTTRDLGTRVGRYTEVDGVIFEHLL